MTEIQRSVQGEGGLGGCPWGQDGGRTLTGLDAMPPVVIAVQNNVCAWSTAVSGGAIVLAVAAEQLHFDADGKFLILAHAFG